MMHAAINAETLLRSESEAARQITRPASSRNVAGDAYRGLVMLLMMGEVLSFPSVARAYPNSFSGTSLLTIRRMLRGRGWVCMT